MPEKEQLIENIILSEIIYQKNKRLGNTASTTADETIVRRWIADFNISNQDIRRVREAVLLKKKQDVEVLYSDKTRKMEEGGALAIVEKEREVRAKTEQIEKDNTLSPAQKVAKKLQAEAELLARKKEIKDGIDKVTTEKSELLAEVDDLLTKPFSF